MRVSVETSGFDRIERELAEAGAEIQPKASLVIKRTAFAIQLDAIQLAPVDTGALINSISVDLREGGGVIEAEIGPTVSYGGYVEEGTSEMAGQPYMRPATDRQVPVMNHAFDRLAGL